MLRTVNYDLCQYEGSDKTSYLVNYNGDMLKIDTAIKNAADAASNAQSTATSASNKADSVESSVGTLNTQINGAGGIAADLVTVQGSVNTINSLIGNGEPVTTDKTIIGAINELAGEIPSGDVDAEDVDYDNTVSGLSATNVQSAIDEVVAALPSAGVDAEDVSYDNTTSGLSATNVQSAIDEVANELTTKEYSIPAGTQSGTMYYADISIGSDIETYGNVISMYGMDAGATPVYGGLMSSSSIRILKNNSGAGGSLYVTYAKKVTTV